MAQDRIIRAFEFNAKHNSAAGSPDQSPDFSKEVSYDLNKDVESIVGIHITSSRRDLVFTYGEAGFTLNGKELMPDNTGAHFFMCGGATPFRDKFFLFYDRDGKPSPEPAGSGTFRIRYTDNGSNAVAQADYTVKVSLLLNLNE